MTKTRNLVAGVAAVLVTLALLAPGRASAASGQTIADFALKVYKGSLSRQEAVAALRALVPSIQNPDARLTEGSLTDIMTAFGVKSATRQPGLLVDQGRADAALLFIWQSASAPGGHGGAGASSTAGGGQINLSTCSVNRNIWACMQCCVEQGAPISSCSYFCTFGVSPSTPS